MMTLAKLKIKLIEVGAHARWEPDENQTACDASHTNSYKPSLVKATQISKCQKFVKKGFETCDNFEADLVEEVSHSLPFCFSRTASRFAHGLELESSQSPFIKSTTK